jgi:ribonuclease HII
VPAAKKKILSSLGDLNFFESDGFQKHSSWIIGLDEVGAGCLSGPLCVAAFAFPADEADKIKFPVRITDSKKLTPEKRQEAAFLLQQSQECYHKLLWLEVREIESINIYWARMKAFWTLILELDEKFSGRARYVVDGPKLGIKHGVTPAVDVLEMMELQKRVHAQSKADSHFFSVAAASILAKVARDNFMKDLSAKFPHFNWEKNKGYATPDHIEAIKTHGICEHHRKSFCGNFGVDLSL